jgi:hypothetical protein
MKFVYQLNFLNKKFIFIFFKLILNAKCHAIRDAQLLEKQQIKKEMVEEDKRLDMMMEIERLNALKIQEEIELRRQYQAKE